MKRGFTEKDQMVVDFSGVDLTKLGDTDPKDVLTKAYKVFNAFKNWKRLLLIQNLFWGARDRFAGDMDTLKMFKERRTAVGHTEDPMTLEDIANAKRRLLREEVKQAKEELDKKKAALKASTSSGKPKAKPKPKVKSETSSSSSSSITHLIQSQVDDFFRPMPRTPP